MDYSFHLEAGQGYREIKDEQWPCGNLRYTRVLLDALNRKNVPLAPNFLA